MKRMNNIAWPLLLLVFGLSGCFLDFEDDGGPCIRGSGPIVSQEFNLPDFHSINLEIPAKVILTQGPVQSVRAEGQANVIRELRQTVRSRVWDIQFRNCVRTVGDLTLYITIPEVRSLRNAATRDIVSENFLIADALELVTSGTGNIDIGADAGEIDARLSGTGRIFLEGEADLLKVNIPGTGDLRGFKLRAQQADVRISGTGDAEVWVEDYLNIRITGTGSVFYRGIPRIDVAISGTGRVVNRN